MQEKSRPIRNNFIQNVSDCAQIFHFSLIFMALDKDRSRRFGEPAKFLPVLFVIALIATVYGTYTYVCFQSLIFLIHSLIGTSFPASSSECISEPSESWNVYPRSDRDDNIQRIIVFCPGVFHIISDYSSGKCTKFTRMDLCRERHSRSTTGASNSIRNQENRRSSKL